MHAIAELNTDQIERRTAIVIGKAGERDLTGHLFLPSISSTTRPALVIVHGGGWRKGSPRGVRGFGEFLSRTGYVCLCPAYRLSGEAHWPAQIEDVKCAIRYLKANSGTFGIDKNRVGILGDSAGGHLALMAAVQSTFEGLGGYTEESSDVQAVGSLYGPVRIRKQRANGLPMGLLALDAPNVDYELAGPIHYDLANFPPCLLIHGVDDRAVPIGDSNDFYRKLMSLGRIVELHAFAGEGHAFDRRSSMHEGMVDVLDPSSINGPTIIHLIARFFDKYL